jgi:hypothetical protein
MYSSQLNIGNTEHPGTAYNRQPDPPPDQTQFPINPADRTGVLNQCGQRQPLVEPSCPDQSLSMHASCAIRERVRVFWTRPVSILPVCLAL